MKMTEVWNLLYNKPKGFMVSFEWCSDGFLRSDHFPDTRDGEKLIDSEHEAWELAERFARVTKGRACNLYVVDDNFKPVYNYRDRIIANR